MSDAPTLTTDEQEAPPPAPRLLLVDDEPGLRTAVQAYLEDEGFDVTTAVDGEEGFSKAQQMLPDVVISDVCLLYTSPSPRDRQKSRMPSSA